MTDRMDVNTFPSSHELYDRFDQMSFDSFTEFLRFHAVYNMRNSKNIDQCTFQTVGIRHLLETG